MQLIHADGGVADKGYRREITMISPVTSAPMPSVQPSAPAPVAAKPEAAAAPADTVHISPQASAMHDGDGDGH